MGIREERNAYSAAIVDRIEKCLQEEFGDIFRTGDNFNTLTFYTGTFNGDELFGSVKFTLHKPTYDLDEEIEVFEDFYAMREKSRKNKVAEEKVEDIDEEDSE